MLEASLSDNAISLLNRRYLDGGETIEGMWDRVSGGNDTYRSLLSRLHFLPNSPTLFNAGRNNGCTLSACFVFNIADSMFGPSSIDETRTKATAVAKAGGGVGYWFSGLRPKGSPIKTVHRVACGPVSVLQDYHGISRLISQGGKRELAQMGVLDCDHPDIREFIHCKDKDPQSLSSFNISVGWKSANVDGVLDTIDGGVSSPDRELWEEQCTSAWSHGCPGMFFPDTVNRCNPNPHLGLMLAPNPCGETPNRSDEPCNLGSIPLPYFFDPGNRSIDWKRLEEVVWNSIMFLDDILEWNIFPHPSITQAAILTRKLGLGVMGWADLLAMMHIHYDTEEAINLADRLMGFIAHVANGSSEKIATRKGPYKGYSDKTNGPLRRNETLTSIAPTGSIGVIGGVKGFSIEPWFAHRNDRITSDGLCLIEDVPAWMREHISGFRPKVANEIHYKWHIRHQAAFQKHTDLGVSKTINLPESATVQDVSNAYRMMYEMNCKGGTIFRENCRPEAVLTRIGENGSARTHNVFSTGGHRPNFNYLYSLGNDSSGNDSLTLNLDNGISQQKYPVPDKSPDITTEKPSESIPDTNVNVSRLGRVEKPMPRERDSKTVKVKIGGTSLFLTAGIQPGGRLGEVFVNGNFGSTMAGLLNAFCITFSVALQNGVSLENLVHHHMNTRFEPSGLTDNPDVPHCTSITDFIVRWLGKKFLGQGKSDEVTTSLDSGAFCPDCGAVAIYQAGCLTCPVKSCGWSKCG